MKYIQNSSFIAKVVSKSNFNNKISMMDTWELGDKLTSTSRADGVLTLNDQTHGTAPMMFWFGCYGVTDGVGCYVIRSYARNSSTDDAKAFHGHKLRYGHLGLASSDFYEDLTLNDDPPVRGEDGELFFIDFNGKRDAGTFETSAYVGPYFLLGVEINKRVAVLQRKHSLNSVKNNYLVMDKRLDPVPLWFDIVAANVPEFIK